MYKFLCLLLLMTFIFNVNAEPVQWLESQGGNGHYYEVVKLYKPRSLALSDAKSRVYQGLKGNLVSITSAEEQSFVANLYSAETSESFAWIGLSDENTEGKFEWSSKEAVSYTNFYYSTRSTDTTDFTIISNTSYNGKWFYAGDTTSRYYIVEYADLPPNVSAGIDQHLSPGESTQLAGVVSDDQKPLAELNLLWIKVSGPGEVTFADDQYRRSGVSFSLPGTYKLKLEVSDGQNVSSDEVEIIVPSTEQDQEFIIIPTQLAHDAVGMVQDQEGNIYVLGYTDIDLDGTGSEIHHGEGDYYLAKYDISNQLVWFKQAGSDKREEPHAISLKNNKLYISGKTRGSIDGQNHNLYTNEYNCFIASYDFDGNELLIKQFEVLSRSFTHSTRIPDIEADSNGNIYVIGHQTLTTLSSDTRVFIKKFDSTGNELWSSDFGTVNGWDEAWGLCLDNSDQPVLTGKTGGDLSRPSDVFDHSFYGEQLFIVRYSTGGVRTLTKTFWHQGTFETGRDIKVDSSGDYYITGTTNGKLYDPASSTGGKPDAFIAKFNSSGNPIWINQIENGSKDGTKLVLDDELNCYLFGEINGSLYNGDVFLAKFDSTGDKKWVKEFGETGHDLPVALLLTSQYELKTLSTLQVRDEQNSFLGHESIVRKHLTGNVNPNELIVDILGSVVRLPVISYGGSQDSGTEAPVSNNGSTVTLTGNSWKAVDLTSIDINPDTVLEVTFSSNSEGEIHGIGFDNDLNISGNLTFTFFGTQVWGFRDFADYVSPDEKTYRIPVGQYFTGNFRYLTFVCDHDVSVPDAQSIFSNISIQTNNSPEITVPAYADNDDITLPDGTSLHVEASDPDGDPLTYQWTKISGPGNVSFGSADAADTTVSFEVFGSYVLQVAVSDGTGTTVSLVSVNVNPNASDLLNIDISGSVVSLPVITYDPSQDISGTAAVSNGGQTLSLNGNLWKAVDLTSLDINPDTVLEVTFNSSVRGEIHGIGFDTDNSLSANYTFKFMGTQNWGISNFATSTVGSTITYKIPVGQFYTGTFRYLTFVCDHDISVPNAESVYSDIKIYDNVAPEFTTPAYADENIITLPSGTAVHALATDADSDSLTYSWSKLSGPGNVTFDSPSSPDSNVSFTDSGEYVLQVKVSDGIHEIFSEVLINVEPASGTVMDIEVFGNTVSKPVIGYGGSQDGNGTSVISEDANTLTLTGNKWKAVDLTSVNITADTILEVTFSSDTVGEIQGIGFDNDMSISSNTTFKFLGTQVWGISAFADYETSQPRTYRIPVGQYFTGSYRYLTFVCDHDVSTPTAQAVYSSIKIINRDDTSANSEAGNVAGNEGLTLDSITVYADADENIFSEWLIDEMALLSIFDRGDAPHKAYDVDATLGPVILKDINGVDFNNSDEFKALVEMQLATGDDPVVISYKVETDSGGFNISYVIGATGVPVVSGQEILIPVDINRDNWQALVFDLESDLFEGTGLSLIEVDSIELNGKLKIDNIALFKTAD